MFCIRDRCIITESTASTVWCTVHTFSSPVPTTHFLALYKASTIFLLYYGIHPTTTIPTQVDRTTMLCDKPATNNMHTPGGITTVNIPQHVTINCPKTSLCADTSWAHHWLEWSVCPVL